MTVGDTLKRMTEEATYKTLITKGDKIKKQWLKETRIKIVIDGDTKLMILEDTHKKLMIERET